MLFQIGWFPDGNTLLIVTWNIDSGSAWTLSIFGDKPTELRDGVRRTAVSPDGSQIAFEKVLPSHEVWLMNAHGENPRRLLTCNDQEVSSLAWSPDGRYLAYFCSDESRPGGTVAVGCSPRWRERDCIRPKIR